MTSIVDQWHLVRQRRAEFGDGDICVGEATARLATMTVRNFPIRLIDPETADALTATTRHDLET